MQIYVARDGQQLGPFDLETIRSGLDTGTYTPDQLGWFDGAPGWMPLTQVPGLEPTHPPAIPPPMPAMASSITAPGWQHVPQATPGNSGSAATPPIMGPARGQAATGQMNRRPPGNRLGKTIGLILIVLFGLWVTWRGLHQVWHALAGRPPAITRIPAGQSTIPAGPSITVVATRHYVNDRKKCTAKLAEHFIDFSFDYPATWTVLEDGGSGPDYVTLAHQADGTKDDLEKIIVGFFFEQHGHAAASLPSTGPLLIQQMEKSVAEGFPHYHKVAEAKSTFGNYPSYAATFTSHIDDKKTPLDVWGREDIVAPPEGPNGVFVMLLATSESKQVKGVDDLGAKGDLLDIVNSFRFGK